MHTVTFHDSYNLIFIYQKCFQMIDFSTNVGLQWGDTGHKVGGPGPQGSREDSILIQSRIACGAFFAKVPSKITFLHEGIL